MSWQKKHIGGNRYWCAGYFHLVYLVAFGHFMSCLLCTYICIYITEHITHLLVWHCGHGAVGLVHAKNAAVFEWPKDTCISIQMWCILRSWTSIWHMSYILSVVFFCFYVLFFSLSKNVWDGQKMDAQSHEDGALEIDEDGWPSVWPGKEDAQDNTNSAQKKGKKPHTIDEPVPVYDEDFEWKYGGMRSIYIREREETTEWMREAHIRDGMCISIYFFKTF